MTQWKNFFVINTRFTFWTCPKTLWTFQDCEHSYSQLLFCNQICFYYLSEKLDIFPNKKNDIKLLLWKSKIYCYLLTDDFELLMQRSEMIKK